jgi:hypothetical protein
MKESVGYPAFIKDKVVLDKMYDTVGLIKISPEH